MTSTEYARSWWTYLRARALSEPTHTVVVNRSEVPHPRDAGAYMSIGLPVGQDEDFRFPPEHDCRGVHAQSFGMRWIVHVDEVHPDCDATEHLRRDAPGAFVAALTALGGLLGLALGRRKETALAGAILGAAVGIATAGSRGDDTATPTPGSW